MCSSRRHGWVGEHGGPKAEPDQHCCVGWCETSAQHGEARPAHCPTYRSRPEKPDLFRVQTLSQALVFWKDNRCCERPGVMLSGVAKSGRRVEARCPTLFGRDQTLKDAPDAC